MIREIPISDEVINYNVKRILSQTFALLPMREEGKDWQKPLETLTNEVLGLSAFLPNEVIVLSVACKLQGLLETKEEDNFPFYRRTIFECCSLLSKLLKEE